MEKTFKEVIADIKEGEVWESELGNMIIKNETGIRITHENVYAGGFFVAIFDDKTKYKLQRKQYTFEEAFKAYEEGKEIESCESGEKYAKNLVYGDDCKLIQETNNWLHHAKLEEIISFDEIRNKWYINN